MNLDQYRNDDGTYTSPKNGKSYKSIYALRSHIFYNSDNFKAGNLASRKRKSCQYCDVKRSLGNIIKHEESCYLNPKHLRKCVVCEKPIIDYKRSKGTCSHACSNKHFRHIRNKPSKYKHYQTICFHYHGKKCLVCGEEKIVAAHHVNGNHDDNRPENLVPLCPTHHVYVHSKYKDEVQPIIDNYVNNE